MLTLRTISLRNALLWYINYSVFEVCCDYCCDHLSITARDHSFSVLVGLVVVANVSGVRFKPRCGSLWSDIYRWQLIAFDSYLWWEITKNEARTPFIHMIHFNPGCKICPGLSYIVISDSDYLVI
jgi:hypothetical protein